MDLCEYDMRMSQALSIGIILFWLPQHRDFSIGQQDSDSLKETDQEGKNDTWGKLFGLGDLMEEVKK